MKITRRGPSQISAKLARKERQLNDVKFKAFDFFRRVTPIDKGNARRNTRLNGSTIEANYPYAQRLNKGWSKQAPRGMFVPTLDYIRRVVKRILGA
jgi:hypothetical protein